MRVVAVVAVLLSLIAESAAAQAPGPEGAPPSPEVRPVEPVVVTATKLETPVEQLGASVTVITGEELEAHHYQDVADALRRVPGLDVQRAGTAGKLTSLRIRGANPQQIQVLVDGLRVKSPSAGTFDFAEVLIEGIERIEVVRGPQATLYGADAIGGVVNIITRRGRGRPTPALSVEAGTRGTHRQRLSIDGSWQWLDYAFSAFNFGTDGQFPNDASVQRGASGRLGVTLPHDGHVSLTLRHARTEVELPVDRVIATPPFFVLDPDAFQETAQTTLGLAWTQRPVPWYELQLRFGHFWHDLTFVDGPLPPGDFPFRSRIDNRRREVELINAFHAGRWNTLSVGIEHREEFARSHGDFSTAVTTWGGFIHDELRLFDRLFLSGGVRVEDHEVFGTEATPRAGVAYLVRETGTKLRGSWGRGFRAPTLNDLFFPGASNPDLRPERSESWEAGVDQRLWRDRLRLGLAYFRNDFRDLIQFDLGTFQPQNIARARAQGIEVTAEADVLDTLLVTLAYTLTDTEDLDTGLPLRRFARHRWTLGLAWDPLPRVNVFLQTHVVSSQFEGPVLGRNPGHHRIDVGGSYRAVERRGAIPAVDVTLRVNNVTDQRYFEVFGFQAPGVTVLAGARASY
jgi:vitamin B12 transporter